MRLLLWKSVMNRIAEKPFAVTGYGSFYALFPEYRHILFDKVSPVSESVPFQAHNEFLERGFEGGVLLLGLYLLFNLSLIQKGIMIAKAKSDPETRYFFAALTSALLALLADGVFSVNLRVYSTQFYYYFIAGLIIFYPGVYIVRDPSARRRFSAPVILAVVCLLSGAFFVKFYAADMYYKTGCDLTDSGEWGGAKTFFKRALDLNPGSCDMYYKYAFNAYMTRDYTESAAYYRRVMSIAPYFANVLFNYGTVASDLKNMPEAEKYLKKAWQMNPYGRDTNFNLATIYYIAGKFDKAAVYYKKLTRLYPSTAEYFGYAAQSLEASGKQNDSYYYRLKEAGLMKIRQDGI